MLHFKHSSTRFAKARMVNVALLTVCASALFSNTANPAVVPDAFKSRVNSETLTANLSALDGISERILDWRNPSATISFDIPEGDWSDGISLKLSATPKGSVSPETPLLISFNNGTPVPVHSDGHSFDAEVILSKMRIKPRNNTIKITYKTPSGTNCLDENDGAWLLNLERSELIVKSRARQRDYRMGEIEPRLASLLAAPDTVAIIAKGENTPKFQALAAQAIGLRMTNVPKFVTSGSGDVIVRIGTRSELSNSIKSETIRNESGPRISVDSGRPLSIIVTGDTESEVLEMSQAFAQRHLPNARRHSIALSEMTFQTDFNHEPQVITDEIALTDLGKTYFDRNFRPDPVKLQFTVEETEGTRGELLLQLSKNDQVANSSRMDVTLNGQALGYTQLNKRNKYVAFNLPSGSLKPSDNEIVITPVLDAMTPGCAAYSFEPGISLGTRSKLTISSEKNTLSLSGFAASGAPFSNNAGADTTVLISHFERERGAILAILAKAAKAGGTGWTEANFLLASDVATLSHGHVLMLGTGHSVTDGTFGTAPRALSEAMRGIVDPNLTAQTVNFAANSEQETFKQYAALSAQKSRSLSRGGIAAIYESPQLGGYAVGVMTARSQSGFVSASNQLTSTQHWNALSGSVVRWDRQSVIMAQAASSYKAPKGSGVNSSNDSAGGNLFGSIVSSLGQAGTSVKTALAGWTDKLTGSQSAPKAATAEQTLRVTPKADTHIIASPRLKPTPVKSVQVVKTNPPASAAIPSFNMPKSLTLRGKAAYVQPVNQSLVTSDYVPSEKPISEIDVVAPAQVTTANHSGFDFDYFKANVSAKANSTRNLVSRWRRANFNNDKLGKNTKTILSNYHIVMLGMIALLAIVLIGFASPASASTRRD